MPKLNLSGITNKEAYERRKKDLSRMNMSVANTEVCVLTKDGKPLVYKLKDVVVHLERVMQGKADPIGERELHYAKEVIAYERDHGS